MKRNAIVLVLLFVAGNASLVAFSPYWFLQAALCGLFLLAAVAVQTRSYDRFYSLCAGQPAVVVAGTVSPWVAFVLELLLLGFLAEGAGYLRSYRDGLAFAVFCVSATVIAAFALSFRHVLLPLVVLAIAGLVAVGACLLAEYRYTAPFRRNIP